ncbi:MAG: transglycosylase domain-containing protein [Candidatus Dormibacteria bacterium]
MARTHPEAIPLAAPRRRRASAAPAATPPRRARPLWQRLLLAAGIATGAVLVAGVAGFAYVSSTLPSLASLQSSHLKQTTRIYDRLGPSGTLLDEIYDERRTVVSLDHMAPVLRDATIAVEDRTFYSHQGVNPLRIASAAAYDLTHGDSLQGASTIDQQVIKLSVLGSEQSFSRKVREAVMAVELEHLYSKDQILEFYLNRIYYGNQAYGIEAAAETYFGVHASELDLPDASMLAGLPQRPSALNPFDPASYPAARARQQEVLMAMVRDGDITQQQSDDAFAVDLAARMSEHAREARLSRKTIAPHFVDYVRRVLEDTYGDQASQGGLTVTTTLDLSTQTLAETSVTHEVQSIGHNVNNGAMLVMDPRDGEIRAMVGSVDFNSDAITGQVNMTDVPLQPGSTFKPYVYGTALENGWTPNSILVDAGPVINGFRYQDWDGQQLGAITFRQSLALSRNLSSIKLLRDVGMAKVFDLVGQLGITTPMHPVLGTAIGASEVLMTEHLAAYNAFANGGFRTNPVVLLRVTDADGHELDLPARPAPGSRVMPAMVAYQITDILKGAVNRAWGLTFPIAGKSGTTNEYRNSWYVGYTRDLSFATWMGHTEPGHWLDPLDTVYGETGAGLIWKDFAAAYYQTHPKPLDWQQPSANVRVLLCDDGRLADHEVPGITHYAYLEPDAVPKEYCDQSSPPTPSPVYDSPQAADGPSPAPAPSPSNMPTLVYTEPSPSPSPTPPIRLPTP